MMTRTQEEPQNRAATRRSSIARVLGSFVVAIYIAGVNIRPRKIQWLTRSKMRPVEHTAPCPTAECLFSYPDYKWADRSNRSRRKDPRLHQALRKIVRRRLIVENVDFEILRAALQVPMDALQRAILAEFGIASFYAKPATAPFPIGELVTENKEKAVND